MYMWESVLKRRYMYNIGNFDKTYSVSMLNVF